MASPRPWVLLPLAAMALVACKPKSKPDAPGRDVRSWTLAEIEAELARNDQALAGEGIVVAMASPTGRDDGPTATPWADAETEALDAGADDDDGTDAVDPVARPVMPGPAPVDAPAAPSYEPEARERTSADGPARTNRRRSSSRARRDAATRCERVCGLSEATCELEAQICTLAMRHPDEPRYAQACARAEQQCIAAVDACDRCEE
jgi:hypothetical protein